MGGALCYPNWSINNPVHMGEFLLFWDRLTFMTPSTQWNFNVEYEDKAIEKALKEAHEKYALAHMPTEVEKAKCDKIIRNLYEKGPREFAKYAAVIGQRPYPIDVRKLADKTVSFLEEQKVLKPYYDETYLAGEAGGHLVMAVLASCCSTKQLPAVTTDDTQFTLQMLSLDDSLATKSEFAERPMKNCDAAFSMIIKKIKLPKAGNQDPKFLSRVLQARTKDDVNGLRAVFQSSITRYSKRLAEAESAAEIGDILADFDSSVDIDLQRLNQELRAAGVDALSSKDGFCAFLGGAVLGLASLGLGALGGSILAWRSYRKERQSVLSKHWTSWLHQIEHPSFSIW